MSTKKGPLTTLEKYAIQGALADGKTVAEIEAMVGRPAKTIQTYVGGELDTILDAVVKSRLNRALEGDTEAFADINEPATDAPVASEERVSDSGNKLITAKEAIAKKIEEENAPATVKIPEEVLENTVKLLRGIGLKDQEARHLLARACKDVMRMPNSPKELFDFAKGYLTAGNYMLNQTQNGREGVAIMTGAASMAGDEAVKRNRNRTAPGGRSGNIYRPKSGNIT